VISGFIRNFVGLFLCLIAVGGSSLLNVILVLSNYLACKVSFDLLGFDQRPLGSYELVGDLLGVFFGEATLADFYALVVAVTVAGGFFLVFLLLFDLIHLLGDRRVYLNLGDHDSSRVVTGRIIHDLFLLAVMTIPLAVAIRWDLRLFEYRWVTGALGFDDPTIAPGQVETLDEQLLKYGHLFAWSIARLGAWGYVAITVLAELGLKVALYRTSQYWQRLMQPFDALLEPTIPQERQMLCYGYDEHEQPVYDPQTPIAYTPDGIPVPGYRSTTVDEAPGASDHVEVVDQPQPVASARPAAVPTDVIDASGSIERPPVVSVASELNSAGSHASAPQPLFESAPLPCPPWDSSTPLGGAVPRSDHSRLRDVIGGAEGSQISQAKALADKEQYVVDLATEQIWDRQYWEQLHGRTADTDAPKAA
jgi:hypothetical protein